MLKKLTDSLRPSKGDELGNAFSRLGWGGLWGQVMMGAIPFAIMLYTLVFTGASAQGARSGLPFVQYFSTIDLFLLIFIVFWFYRYTRIGRRMRRSPERVSVSAARRTVWIGLVATTFAILFSMLVLLFEVGNMLFYFLAAPQAGVPTFQTTVNGFASWVSAVDMMNLLSLILTLGGEILALIIGLLLLFRTMQVTEAPKGS